MEDELKIAEKKYMTTFYTDKDTKTIALKIAKKKGINTLNGLLNILLVEYIDKHRDLVERK